MIAFWNRREVFMSFDMELLVHVREVLSAAGIDYQYRSVGYNKIGRAGAFGGTPTYAAMYYVYVHKDDFDRAQQVLHPFR